MRVMLDFLGKFWAFLPVRRKFWLVPVIVVALGALLVLG